METLLPDLDGKTVLDLACGTGRWLERLHWLGASRSLGIDLSGEMLGVALAKPSVSSKLARADCLAIPVRDRSMHLIICSFGVSYMADIPALAREVARVSRAGADVYVSDLHPSWRDRGWKRSFRHKDGVIEIDTFCYSLTEICDAFGKAGFTLMARTEPKLGEPERGIFAQAGKLEQFDSACTLPAIYVLHFHVSAKTENAAISI